MNWKNLENKTPDFNTKYLIWLDDKPRENVWTYGWLKSIKSTEDKKEYEFKDQEGKPITNVTHFLIIEPPK